MKQFNRVHDTPNEVVEKIKIPEAYGEWRLCHIGCYLGLYGPTCYVDITKGEKQYRFYLPKYHFNYIDKISHDQKFMTKVHNGMIIIRIRYHHSIKGYDSYLYDLYEMKGGKPVWLKH